MAEILTFALVAPLGAMGSLAVGERRGTWDRPGRSAVLGLVAGCLGLTRTEEEAQAALSAGLGIAVRRLGRATKMLADYQTAQTAPARRAQVPLTRYEELSAERKTVLTRRDYHADIAFTVALWQRDTRLQWTPCNLADALRNPVFVPYMGRKSCPLGLPMAPLIVEARTVRAAFQRRDAEAAAPERAAFVGVGGTVWIDTPGVEDPPLGLDGAHTDWRRDNPIGRLRWQFDLRAEVVAPWPPT